MTPRILIIFLFCALCGCIEEPDRKSGIGNELSHTLRAASSIRTTYPDSAFILARKVYEASLQDRNNEIMASSMLLMGEIMYDLGDFSQANQFLIEAQSAFREAGINDEVARADLMLSRIYQRSENYEQAFIYLENARSHYALTGNGTGLARVYADLGHIYEKLQQYDSAIVYQNRALRNFRRAMDTVGLAMTHENIGSIHEDLENYDEAYNHFDTAYLLNTAIQDKVHAIGNLNNLGDIYRKTGDLQNAIAFTKEALALARQNGQEYEVKSAYRDLSKIYAQLGVTDSAFHFLDRSYELTDNLFSRQIAEEIARTQSVYELQQKQQRIAFLERSEKTNRMLALVSTGGIIMLILLGSVIFRQQRQKNRKARQLLETETALTRIELENAHLSEQKLKAELENKELREIRLQHELELKAQSLTKSTLHMIQKNEFLQMMRNKLKSLKKVEDPEVRKVIKRIIRSIDINSNVDDDWREFEAVFAQVHSSFYEKLQNEYPDLSPSEVRLCAMIRLNLHSKDMATIMGITPDSLRTARYRLRKRLGISQGENLYNRLMKIH